MIRAVIFLLIVISIGLTGCGQSSIAGGGGVSETTNGIAGVVKDNDAGVEGVVVSVYPEGYNPLTDSAYKDTTDSEGRFSFSNLSDTVINLEISTENSEQSLLIQNLKEPYSQDIGIYVSDLNPSGSIIISLSELNAKDSGYVYIPGTEIYQEIDSIILLNEVLVLKDVPAGNYSKIIYVENPTDSSLQNIIEDSIEVSGGDSVLIHPFADWKHYFKININTTASGGNSTKDLINFPLLVRLDKGTFDFDQVKGKGEDIRFLKSDYSKSFPYEIESWDSLNGKAIIWVKVDTVFKESDSQYLFMFWGNSSVSSTSSSQSVFNSKNGMAGVWHLNERPTDESSIIFDASDNQNNGTPFNLGDTNSVEGAISGGLNFNGINSYITVADDSSLKFGNGNFVLSAWVKPDTVFSRHQIISKRTQLGVGDVGNYEIQMQMEKTLAGYLEIVGASQDSIKDTVTSADTLGFDNWNHVALRRRDGLVSLFINGVEQDEKLNSRVDVSSSGVLSIGRDGVLKGEYFPGIIDEVRVVNRSRSKDWIRFCYENQKQESKVISFDN